MRLANFANDASSMVHLRSSPWHIPCQPYGRLSIVVHHPSVSIRAAQSGLQSAPACRMRWVCHHLFRSYGRNLSNIANIRLLSVSGHTFLCKDKTFPRNFQGFMGKCCGVVQKENRRLSELRTTYWILFWFQSLITFSMEEGYCGNLYSICLFLFSHFITLYLFFPPTH